MVAEHCRHTQSPAMLALLLASLIVSAVASPSAYIVGGRDVERSGKWPHQASIILAADGDHDCGGVVISRRWILTAAHCINDEPSAYQVVLGMHDRIAPRQYGKPVIYDIEEIISHPDFEMNASEGYPNDIAVIKLTKDIEYNDHVQPIQMAEEGHDFKGEECWVTGWGSIYGWGPQADILQEAEMNVVTQATCKGFWGKKIRDDHICIYDLYKKESTVCSGDSGGPLVCRPNENKPFMLAGVTSWGWSFCLPERPTIYTRVSAFRSWIREQTGV